MAGQKVRVRISKKQAIVFLAILAAFAASVGGYLAYAKYFSPVFAADFEGQTVQFRANLREAQAVEVLPDEGTLTDQIVKPPRVFGPGGQVILRQPLVGAVIAFKADGVQQSTLGWYSVEVTEIIKKLTLLYKGKHNVDIRFNVTEVKEYGRLNGTNTVPVIELVHPELADGTFVSADRRRNVITISGGDSLKDFDLATVKFMMVALGIGV